MCVVCHTHLVCTCLFRGNWYHHTTAPRDHKICKQAQLHVHMYTVVHSQNRYYNVYTQSKFSLLVTYIHADVCRVENFGIFINSLCTFKFFALPMLCGNTLTMKFYHNNIHVVPTGMRIKSLGLRPCSCERGSWRRGCS